MIIIVKNEWKVRARLTNANTIIWLHIHKHNNIQLHKEKKYRESDKHTMPH